MSSPKFAHAIQKKKKRIVNMHESNRKISGKGKCIKTFFFPCISIDTRIFFSSGIAKWFHNWICKHISMYGENATKCWCSWRKVGWCGGDLYKLIFLIPIWWNTLHSCTFSMDDFFPIYAIYFFVCTEILREFSNWSIHFVILVQLLLPFKGLRARFHRFCLF